MAKAQPEPGSQHSGMGYTNMALLRAWEASLTGNRLRAWRDLREAIENAAPETRTAVVSLCLELDLQEGRSAYGRAWKQEQRFKADLIKANGKQLAEKIGWLSVSVQEALSAIETHRAVGAWAMRKADHALGRLQVLSMVRTQFQRVINPWVGCEPGAEWGKGITGYDSSEGVAEARKRHEARMAQAQRERLAKDQRQQAAVQPQVENQREVDRKAASLREGHLREGHTAAPFRPSGEREGGLFGRR